MVDLRYRRRTRPGLGLDTDRQVNPVHGRHDKIEITVEGVVTDVDPDDFRMFRVVQADAEPGWGLVFTAPKWLGPGSVLQQVAKKRWLFTGKAHFSPTAVAGQWRAVFRLSLNPSRFAAYLRRFGETDFDVLRQKNLHELLLREEGWRQQLEAASADGSDNHIPARDPWVTTVTAAWPQLLRLYIDAVARFIETDFNRRAADVSLVNVPHLTLRSPADRLPQVHRVEVHWEMVAEDARLSYQDIANPLRASAEAFVETEKVITRNGRTAAARWINVRLNRGIAFTVYVKTDGRLRYEVSYTARRGPDSHSESIGDLLRSAHRFAPHMSFLDRLDRIRADAAQRLNDVLRGLPIPSTRAPAVNDTVRLMAEIARLADGDRRLIHEVFVQLATDQAITTTPHSRLRRVADGLEKADLVHHVGLGGRPRTRRYVLADGVILPLP